jgi:AraC-like DNA-binding protein
LRLKIFVLTNICKFQRKDLEARRIMYTMLNAAPSALLRPFVKQLWMSSSSESLNGLREKVLPTGQMHLVFRLKGPALRIFYSANDSFAQTIDEPVVGGTRTSWYLKEIGAPVISIGAQLLPGASQLLFGVSAAELAGQHTPLSELWGTQADFAREQICTARNPHHQLQILDNMLTARLTNESKLHPAVAGALRMEHDLRINDLVRNSRYSHRGFIALFKEATGLSPKKYACLMRFQKLLKILVAPNAPSLADAAMQTGYSDQAHMQREFRAFAGMTPQQYRRSKPPTAHHVPMRER